MFNGNVRRTLHSHRMRGHNAQKVDFNGSRQYVEMSARSSWTAPELNINAKNEANRSFEPERKSREPSQWRVLDARRAAAKRLSVFVIVDLAPVSRLDAGAIRFLSPVGTRSTRVECGPPKMEDR
jgi:hypothetical protein